MAVPGICFGRALPAHEAGSSVAPGAFLAGQGPRTEVQAGLSLAQIGEFSSSIAGLGLALGATRDLLCPVAVSAAAITTPTTLWLVRASGPAASWADRSLPRPLQTVAALCGTWLERLRASPTRGATASQARGPVHEEADALAQLREVLPGLGEPVSIRIEGASAAAGRSLADLNLRGATGATVLAIWRAEGGVMVPSAQEVLRAGDVLAVAGTAEALARARRLLGAAADAEAEPGPPRPA